MIPDTLGGVLSLLPTGAWLMLAFGTVVIAWGLGGDDDRHSNQDSITRILSGLLSLIFALLKFGGQIAVFVGAGFAGLLQRAGAALRRLGRWAEENVTIEIVLDGHFWQLIIVLALIVTGYLTVSALQF